MAKFSTYATWWIQASVRTCFFKLSRVGRGGDKQEAMAGQIKKIQTTYFTEHGENPSLDYLAQQMELSPRKVADLLQETMPSLSRERSLNVPVYDDGIDFQETLSSHFDGDTASVEADFLRSESAELFGKILATVALSAIERDVLERRFGLKRKTEQTLQEIGDEKNVSRERIRQIQVKALRKLRAVCDKFYDDLL